MPKIVDKEEKKREIALAALGAFAEQGLESTSMNQIAEAAGVGKGTIYEYFESKAELMLHAAVAWIEASEVGIEAAIDPAADPETRLRQLCRITMDAFMEDPRMIKLFFGFIKLLFDEPEAFQRFDFVRRLSAPMRTAIVGILLDGVSKGVFWPAIAKDAEKIAINTFAYLDGLGMHYMINPGFFDLKEQIDFYLDNLLNSIRVHGSEGGNHHA